MAVWRGAAWRSALRACAVPLTKLQSYVLHAMAGSRSLDSYIAGGVAINREGHDFPAISIFFKTQRNVLHAPPMRMPPPLLERV